MKSLTRRHLQRLIATDPSLVIVEALPEPYYRKAHLPGAINLPHTDIAVLAPALIPDRVATVVTYCLNAPCENSGIAARALEALGYTNVRDYAAGKQDWIAAGLPVEKGRQQDVVIGTTPTEPASVTMVSCSLDEDERADRSASYRTFLFAGALERQERPDGYAFRFPGEADWRAKIEDFISSERRCCSFFQIDVSYGAGLGPIWLTLAGPAGTKQFIEDTFDVEPLV